MFKISWNRFQISLIVLTMLILFTGCAMNLGGANNKSSDQWNEVIEGIHTATLFTTVHFSADIFSLHFEPASDELTHIRLDSPAPDDVKKYFDLDIKEENNQLKVSIKGKRNSNMSLSEVNSLRKTALIVQLPAKEYKKVEIDSEVGLIHYEGINVEHLEVSNEVGNIVLQDVNTSQMNIKCSAGLINMYNTSGNVDIQGNVGSVQLNVQSIEDDINIKTDLGNVTIDVENPPQHFSLDLSTDLGSAKTNWNANYDKQTARAVKGQEGINGPHIKVRSSIGNIELR